MLGSSTFKYLITFRILCVSALDEWTGSQAQELEVPSLSPVGCDVFT